MNPITFIFNGYENNPIVKMCIEKQPRHILTEKELLPIIQKLKHSKWAYENKKWSFVGDELRLYLASQSDDFLYIDADVVVENIEDIKMNCCPPNLNNGTFFRANRNTEWVRYYLDIYEEQDVKATVNYRLFRQHPFFIPTQDNIRYRHYFTSFWERYKNRDMNKKHILIFDVENEKDIRRIIRKDEEEWHYYKDCEYFKNLLPYPFF